MCKCLVLPLNLCLASIETSSHPGPCYKKHSALSILVEVTAMLSYPLSPASLSHTHTHNSLFNIRILLCIMNHPPIILSNYRDSNLFQTAVLGQVKERQFIQIDLRIPLKKKEQG